MTQKCNITQGPSSSNNRAEIMQSVDQNDKGSATQDVNQKANIFQDATDGGSNFALHQAGCEAVDPGQQVRRDDRPEPAGGSERRYRTDRDRQW